MSMFHVIFINSNEYCHCDYNRDNETLTHLLKASLGTGILAMPIAFMYAGLVFGIFATIFTALICTHCSYVLVSTFSQQLKKKQNQNTFHPKLNPENIMKRNFCFVCLCGLGQMCPHIVRADTTNGNEFC